MLMLCARMLRLSACFGFLLPSSCKNPEKSSFKLWLPYIELAIRAPYVRR